MTERSIKLRGSDRLDIQGFRMRLYELNESTVLGLDPVAWIDDADESETCAADQVLQYRYAPHGQGYLLLAHRSPDGTLEAVHTQYARFNGDELEWPHDPGDTGVGLVRLQPGTHEWIVALTRTAPPDAQLGSWLNAIEDTKSGGRVLSLKCQVGEK